MLWFSDNFIPAPAALAALAAFVPFFTIATLYDLKERRIPNAVNFAALSAAVAIAAYFKPEFLLGYLAFAAASFAFAYVLYKLGAWAGGDVKFFVALGALYPLAKNAAVSSPFDLLAILAIFLFAALAVVPVLLPIALKKAWARKALKKNAGEALKSALKAAPFSAAVVVVLSFALRVNPSIFLAIVVLAFLLKPPFAVGAAFFLVMLFFEAKVTLAALPASFAAIAFAAFCIKSFSNVSKTLRRRIKVSEAREGDIPAYAIYVERGKPKTWRPALGGMMKAAFERKPLLPFWLPSKEVVANPFAARGLTNEEIRKLKALGVKTLEIKVAMPFAPALGVGWLLAVALW